MWFFRPRILRPRRQTTVRPLMSLYEKQHDGNDQQYPDEVTQCVAADHSEKPQNDQNDRNGFKHVQPPPLTRSGVSFRPSICWGSQQQRCLIFPTSSGQRFGVA